MGTRMYCLAHISYRNSVRPSVRHDAVPNQAHAGEMEIPGRYHSDVVCSFLRANFVLLGEEIPLERGHHKGVPPNNSLFHRYLLVQHENGCR